MSSWRRSWLVVAALLACCGPVDVRTPAAAPAPVRVAPGPQPAQHPYCQNAAPVVPCVEGRCTTAGDECVAGICQPLWNWDCQHRCRPADVAEVLCHGNSAHHGVFRDGRLVQYLAVLQSANLSNCGRPAWQIFDVVPDTEPRAVLDRDSISHWWSPVYDCEKVRPSRYERSDLLASPEAAAWTLYLIISERRSGHGEVQPNE